MIKYLNRDSLALILCLTLSLFIYFSSDSVIVRSVKAELSDVISIITYPQRYYSNLMTTQKENEILSSKLAKMNLLNAELLKYEKQNRELKKLLNYFKEQPLLLQIGKVVNSDNSFLSRTITINLGIDDEVKQNSPVVDINGLIGKVISIGDKASQVQLITDKNFIVSVRVGNDMSVGEFRSTHKKLGIIYGITKTADVSIGDIVYTSGISTIYPDSIPLARVVRINKDNDKPFQDIEVEILADLINFNHIFVVHVDSKYKDALVIDEE